MPRYHQGIFKPKNPSKYRGDVTNIVYRSGWELRLMSHFDLHPGVIWWSSEEKAIPYVSPVDGRVHRYFPDFIICVIDAQNKKQTIMVEVKPYAQTQEPVKKNKINKRYINEVFTWGVNQEKWKQAKLYCEDRGWSFKVMTEKEIFGK